VPEQDIGPWLDALSRLISERSHYQQLAQASRTAALRYASELSVEPFERLLEEIVRKPRDARSAMVNEPAADPLAMLSPEKRRLLALRLRGKTTTEPWFPAVKTQAKMRLFCFPHAGGGTGVFHGWEQNLPSGIAANIALNPVRLPGRETRISEPAFEAMEPLVEALSEAIAPYLDRPFAFFGHSMGAAIAFELARSLRSCNQPLPRCLLVSAARAPQLRRNHIPPRPASDDELLDELRRLDGVPRELLENKEWVRLALPALRADTTLYRNYVYVGGPPLDCPIRAYGGMEDKRITRENLELWAEQTTKDFWLEMLPGGHFFVKVHQAEFLAVLARDLSSIISPG
jgi:surfactin synthase thioesterase subunit